MKFVFTVMWPKSDIKYTNKDDYSTLGSLGWGLSCIEYLAISQVIIYRSVVQVPGYFVGRWKNMGSS